MRIALPAFALTSLGFLAFATAFGQSSKLPLHDGWELQSACKIQAEGPQLSTPGFDTAGWIKTTVPSTVLAAQVAAGIYKDPYYAMNLRKIPGTAYPIGTNFSNQPMPDDSPYRCGWWYRKQVAVPANAHGRTMWLHFGGINNRANLWVNGQQIADTNQIGGAYRIYNFDITKAVKSSNVLVIAIETFAPVPTDLGINWVDWNPAPPDKDMGLWGPVDLETTGPVSVRSPFVATHLEGNSLATADLTVTAELQNATDHAVQGSLEGTAANISFQQPVELAAGEHKSVTFSPEQFPQLKVQHPALWWPAEMGAHPLQTLSIRFVADGKVSDTRTIRFGIREATSELTDKGARLFRINGKPILIRGGGWSQDMLLRSNPERLRQQFKMVEDLHLNTIRLEGKLDTDDFFRLADEKGILVMAGWCCCDQWEHWGKWTPDVLSIATTSLHDQMLRLRHHASIFVWLNGSDNPPPADVEQAYLNVEKETQWPNAILSSASAKTTTVTGHSGVKMSGPYDYVSPSYWLVDTKHGGAFGFNTETSPGPSIPQPDSLRRFIPSDHLWPIDDVWNYHAGGGGFKNLDVFNSAMTATYGMPDSMEDYVRVAQTMTYDSERAMFEAYSRNKYTSTGVVQWMLNNAWPSMIWHLYDYYLDTGGGYFGVKRANEPLHVQYSYNDHSIYVVSSLRTAAPPLTVKAEVYDFNLKKVFDQTAHINVAADSSQRALDIPAGIFQPADSIHFVRLELTNSSSAVVSRNFYWVPATLTTFDWSTTNYTHTPATKYANMQALHTLPHIKIHARMTLKGGVIHVQLKNPSKSLAFQVEVRAKSSDGKPIVPLLWNDDFVELMPGESRELTAELPAAFRTAKPSVTVSGWNIDPVTLR